MCLLDIVLTARRRDRRTSLIDIGVEDRSLSQSKLFYQAYNEEYLKVFKFNGGLLFDILTDKHRIS